MRQHGGHPFGNSVSQHHHSNSSMKTDTTKHLVLLQEPALLRAPRTQPPGSSRKRPKTATSPWIRGHQVPLSVVDDSLRPVSYTHLRAHETGRNLVCRLLLEKK